MLTLSARVTRGPDKGLPLRLARNRRGKLVTADRHGRTIEHDNEEAAAAHVFGEGHGAFFSRTGRGAHRSFHRPRRQLSLFAR